MDIIKIMSGGYQAYWWEIVTKKHWEHKCCIKKNYFINETNDSMNEESILVFTDIIKIYSSTDAIEAVEKLGKKYEKPS